MWSRGRHLLLQKGGTRALCENVHAHTYGWAHACTTHITNATLLVMELRLPASHPAASVLKKNEQREKPTSTCHMCFELRAFGSDEGEHTQGVFIHLFLRRTETPSVSRPRSLKTSKDVIHLHLKRTQRCVLAVLCKLRFLHVNLIYCMLRRVLASCATVLRSFFSPF